MLAYGFLWDTIQPTAHDYINNQPRWGNETRKELAIEGKLSY